ncbi:hypothetical protein AO381_1430 [Moraxella catarrhalis]|nr:hypothetical protein AO381_1430 [Moraxella catarrhalis]
MPNKNPIMPVMSNKMACAKNHPLKILGDEKSDLHFFYGLNTK